MTEANQSIGSLWAPKGTVPSRKPADVAFHKAKAISSNSGPTISPFSFRSLSHLPTCLLPLLKAIMPRGQKSKQRAREKRRQAREDPGDLVSVQATVGLGAEFPPPLPLLISMLFPKTHSLLGHIAIHRVFRELQLFHTLSPSTEVV